MKVKTKAMDTHLNKAMKPHCVTHWAGPEQPGAPRATREDQHRAKGKRPGSKDTSFLGVLILGSFPMPSPVNLYKQAARQCCKTLPKPMTHIRDARAIAVAPKRLTQHVSHT